MCHGKESKLEDSPYVSYTLYSNEAKDNPAEIFWSNSMPI